MKKFIIIAMLTAIMPLAAMAQHEEDTENGVVSLAGREGFTIETKKGDFVFKPYLLVQTSANFNWYDDEGLDKAYNQDNIANSGFSVPYAVLGFTGKAFDKISFNLSINAAASGGALLQQAWFDVQLKKQFAIRVGKFKTPFSHAYLTTLGETLLPNLPVSLTAPVILPYSLNAVTPNIGTGFDLVRQFLRYDLYKGHGNMLCIRRAFAAQVQTKAAAREMIASTIHQKAVAEISTRSFAERRPASLAHSRSILSAIFRQIFSPSCSSVFLASSPSVTVLAPRREETAPSILGRASESLFSSFSTLALRMRTAS